MPDTLLLLDGTDLDPLLAQARSTGGRVVKVERVRRGMGPFASMRYEVTVEAPGLDAADHPGRAAGGSGTRASAVPGSGVPAGAGVSGSGVPTVAGVPTGASASAGVAAGAGAPGSGVPAGAGASGSAVPGVTGAAHPTYSGTAAPGPARPALAAPSASRGAAAQARPAIQARPAVGIAALLAAAEDGDSAGDVDPARGGGSARDAEVIELPVRGARSADGAAPGAADALTHTWPGTRPQAAPSAPPQHAADRPANDRPGAGRSGAQPAAADSAGPDSGVAAPHSDGPAGTAPWAQAPSSQASSSQAPSSQAPSSQDSLSPARHLAVDAPDPASEVWGSGASLATRGLPTTATGSTAGRAPGAVAGAASPLGEDDLRAMIAAARTSFADAGPKAAPLPAPAHEHPAERTDAAAPEPPAGTSRVAAGDRATARSAPQPWNPARLERTDIPRRRRGRAAQTPPAGLPAAEFDARPSAADHALSAPPAADPTPSAPPAADPTQSAPPAADPTPSAPPAVTSAPPAADSATSTTPEQVPQSGYPSRVAARRAREAAAAESATAESAAAQSSARPHENRETVLDSHGLTISVRSGEDSAAHATEHAATAHPAATHATAHPAAESATAQAPARPHESRETVLDSHGLTNSVRPHGEESPSAAPTLPRAVQDAELSPAPAPSGRARREPAAAGWTAMRDLGVPRRLLPEDPTADDADALVHLVRSLPAPPRLTAGPGDVVALLGEPHLLRSGVDLLRRSAGGPVEVVLLGEVPGTERRLRDADDAAGLLAERHRAGIRSVLAVLVAPTPTRRERRAAGAALDELGGPRTWAVLDATRRLDDLDDLLDELPVDEPDVAVAFGVAGARRPGDLLRLDVPVAALDGMPAARAVWAATLDDAARR